MGHFEFVYLKLYYLKLITHIVSVPIFVTFISFSWCCQNLGCMCPDAEQK